MLIECFEKKALKGHLAVHLMMRNDPEPINALVVNFLYFRLSQNTKVERVGLVFGSLCQMRLIQKSILN